MKIEHIDEPRLIFASDRRHVCPRHGISTYGVCDRDVPTRPPRISVGAVGTSVGLDLLTAWIQRCHSPIAAPQTARQPNLYPPFPGFDEDSGFHSKMTFDASVSRALRNRDIKSIRSISSRAIRIEEAVKLYYQEIAFLAQNRSVDVIVCILPEDLYRTLTAHEPSPIEESLEHADREEEYNFRRALKARSMSLRRPLQLIREATLKSNAVGQQDDATKAWNFCTAMYYKFAPTVPWKLARDITDPTSCGVGIAFYRSRDYQTLGTSLAQIFDELGNGLILRGTPVQIGKHDRRPHLSAQQSYELLLAAMTEYRRALYSFPARIVVHKSSNFSDEELDGCTQATAECGVDVVDFVTVMDSTLQLFRNGNYPPFRGTLWHVDDSRCVLYTRGSVWYYKTYPGMYVPRPIELRVVQSELSPSALAREVLGFTKLNWNNTRFDGKYPMTLGCARKVGEIMKYLSDSEQPEIRYAHYM